jgi:hypothetical protein
VGEAPLGGRHRRGARRVIKAEGWHIGWPREGSRAAPEAEAARVPVAADAGAQNREKGGGAALSS